MLRALLVATAACAFAGLFGAPAFGAASPPPPYRPAMPHNVTSAHFKVWYDSDATASDYITQTQASDLAGMAEKAYAAETGWGIGTPVDDGDGHIDIYVVDMSANTGLSSYTFWDLLSAPTSGSVDFAQSVISTDQEAGEVAAAILYLIQLRYLIPSTTIDRWLMYSAGEWAGYKIAGYTSIGGLAPPSLSLDCFDSIDGFMKCSHDSYINNAYARWPFWEYVAQRFGTSFLKDVWQQAAGNGSLGGLQGAIGAKGGTLDDVFGDYAVREMAHGWGIPTLDATDITVNGAPITTGAANGAIETRNIPVDHLAAQIVELTRGDGHGEHACFKATLALSVALPAGVNARPYFYWTGNTAPQAFTVSGSTATLNVPWDTCVWTKDVGYVELINPSTTVDGAMFTLSGTLTVDTTQPATPNADPTLTKITDPITQAPTGDIVPTITLLAPLLLHVDASKPTLRLIVQSNDDGKVHATLGSTDLGTPSVRMGMNDLRFAVPKSLLSALRRSSSTGNVLTLTPVSSSGAATGEPQTRHVAVTPAAQKSKKKK